jgi:D-arabinose 1-dehydrogenase-like Zn-dependent alcohol dehydrogenase
MNIISAVRGQTECQAGIRVVRNDPGFEVFAVIVEGHEVAGRVGDLDHRVQRRLQPARQNFSNHGVIGFAGN